MGIVILMLLEDMGVMSEIAVGEPLIPSQSWLCSKFPSSSFISRFPYLHYSYPLPGAACSHTPLSLPLRFLTSFFRNASVSVNGFYTCHCFSVVKDAFHLTETVD